MRPFEESHTFASYKYAVVEHPYGVPPSFGWGFFTVFKKRITGFVFFKRGFEAFYKAIKINVFITRQKGID